MDDGEPRRREASALAIAPGVMLAGVAGGIAFPILPSVGARVGLPLAFIGLILAANRAARIVSSPIVGLVADRFGSRRTLLAGLLVQIVVMVLYDLGVRTGHPGAYFLVGRILHGPGGSCVFVAGQALALHVGGSKHGAGAGGAVRASMALGVPIGLVFGGILSDLIGEARTFEIAAAALVLATAGAYWLVPDARAPVAKRASLGATFRSLIDKRLAAIGGLNFASTFAGSGMVLTTTVLLVQDRGIALFGLPGKTTASLFMGWLVVSEALSMPYFGRLADRHSSHATLAAAGVAAIIPAMVIIALGDRSSTLALGFGILGCGVGALGPSALALVGKLVAAERRGLAIGVMQVCSDLGGALGPLVGTSLFSGRSLPYFVSAVVVACFLPVALWLARSAREQLDSTA